MKKNEIQVTEELIRLAKKHGRGKEGKILEQHLLEVRQELEPVPDGADRIRRLKI